MELMELAMDKKYVKKISSEVYKKYPDMAGSKPKIITENNPQAKSMQAEKTFQLTYKTVAESNGKKFPRSVRVVASLKGRILRISSSK